MAPTAQAGFLRQRLRFSSQRGHGQQGRRPGCGEGDHGRPVPAVPNGLDVGLAIHGGSEVHTWTDFTSEAACLRDTAASVSCVAGETRLVEMLDTARGTERLKVVFYIGDVLEEPLNAAVEAAKALRLRGCRVVVLHDAADQLAGTHRSAISDAGGCVHAVRDGQPA